MRTPTEVWEWNDLLEEAYDDEAARERRLDCIAGGNHAGNLYRNCQNCGA